jgi:pyruvate dehydrogenase E2 component (dihydrolipoamide acetyltransferase)
MTDDRRPLTADRWEPITQHVLQPSTFNPETATMQIVMPKLGLTMTEATLSSWKKREGESVVEGEIVFEFESDKATMEYEAPASGLLASILVSAGQTVPCGTAVAVLETEVASDAVARASERTQSTSERTQVSAGDTVAVLRAPASTGPALGADAAVEATPAARRRARELGVSLAGLRGRGPNGRLHLADVEALSTAHLSMAHLSTTQAFAGAMKPLRVEATPVARKLAADLGLDLEVIRGTGPSGRVTRDDVLATARSSAQPAPVRAGAVLRPAAPVARVEPLRGVRGVIARRMAESAFTAPHVTLHTEADATALVQARQQINEELAGRVKISYNALLVAICARALIEHPRLNACLVDDAIHFYEPIHIALAVDTERGLLVPVIRDANRLDLVAIQRAGDELIQRALAGASLPDDLAGGTFTITNLGMFDVDGFTPIINQPQAAILGAGRIVSKPVDVGGEVGLRQRMALSLSFDHRIVDGGPAARFLQRVKQLVERPFVLALPPATD